VSVQELTQEATPNGHAEEEPPVVVANAVRSKRSWLDGPGDLTELAIEDVPQPGQSVLIRSLSAGQHARIQNESMTMKGDTMRFDSHRRQILTFLEGVVEPGDFSEEEVNVIAHKYGPAFKLVVDAISEISESSEKAMERVRARFRARR
jgi:hypothetical protein